MRDLEVSKELLSEVLNLKVVSHGLLNKLNNSFNITYMQSEDSLKSSLMPINIYEFAFKNLKQWAKLKNVFDKIDWSEEPEQIFKKAEKLKNEIN